MSLRAGAGRWLPPSLASVAEGKVVKNRMHIDINVGDGQRRAERHEVDAEMRRLVGLGATVIRKHDAAWGPWPEYPLRYG